MSPDLFLTTRDLAALFGVSRQAARAWAAAGRITFTTAADGSLLFSASHAACLRAAGEHGSMVTVGEVHPGDVLSLDGQPVQVTATGPGPYFDRGLREGQSVRWQRGTARGEFTRSGDSTVVRLHAAQLSVWLAA